MTIKLSDVSIGMELPALDLAFTRADLVAYANASGDQNPIHQDEEFAKSVGLPDVIAHGMLTMGRAIQVVTNWVGDPTAVIKIKNQLAELLTQKGFNDFRDAIGFAHRGI